jgi:prepilin-type N-terminal cleavage/methylation domain-containing protein
MHNHLLMSTSHPQGARATRGFGLVEMMIALVLGLVVSGSVVAFIGSIIRANAQTVRITRLNQELRSTSEMIGRELKRAQSVSEPLTNIGNPSGTACTGVDTPVGCHDASIVLNVVNASCITYGYGGSGQGNFRAIFLDTTNTAAQDVKIARGNAAVACTNGTGTALNSPLVTITAMSITTLANGAVDISLSGRMRNDTMATLGDESSNPITRTYDTSLQLRTTAVP